MNNTYNIWDGVEKCYILKKNNHSKSATRLKVNSLNDGPRHKRSFKAMQQAAAERLAEATYTTEIKT